MEVGDSLGSILGENEGIMLGIDVGNKVGE
jgi:hypothetical protein